LRGRVARPAGDVVRRGQRGSDRGVYARRGQGARASGAPVSYTLWFFIANGIVITAVGLAQRGPEVPAYLRRHWGRGAVGGACSAAAYGIALWAMTRAPIALVAVLGATSVIF